MRYTTTTALATTLGLVAFSYGQVPLGTLDIPDGDVILAEEDFGISTIDPILIPLADTGFSTGGSVLADGIVLDLTEAGERSIESLDLIGLTDVDFFFSWATTGTFTDGSSFLIEATTEGTDFTLFEFTSAAGLSGADPAPPFFEFFASPPGGATDAGLDALLASGLDLSDVTFSASAIAGPGSDGTIFLDSVLITGTPIPEPASAALLGIAGTMLLRRRR